MLRAWQRADHHFIYPLDDVYINMAVARNFALHGVWGITPFEFSSCTSSPLYILLLAAVFRLFGVNQYVPLIFSSSFGLAAIFVAGTFLPSVTARQRTGALIAMVVLAPLFAVGVLGMEHSLQLLLTLLFLRVFQEESPLWRIAVITSLLTATRYEGVMMAGVATLVLLASRRWLRAATIAVAAWIPVGAYAVFSIRHGGIWLPNSVAIKGIRTTPIGEQSGFETFRHALNDHLGRAPHLVLLCLALTIAAIALWRPQRRLAGMIGVVAASCALQLIAADVGWAFRYETYLVAAGVLLIAIALHPLKDLRRAWLVATLVPLILAVFVLVERSYLAITLMPEYSRAIYLQQWQTARFLALNYPNATLAANDIGAINYFNDLHCLDLAGLASAPVFEAKRRGDYETELIEQLAATDHIQLAVVYDSWFNDQQTRSIFNGPFLPDSWVRVRQWSVPEKQQLGSKTISWYAMDEASADQLRDRLLAFEPSLPAVIKVED